MIVRDNPCFFNYPNFEYLLVRHERTFEYRLEVCTTAQKMRVGPSEPAYRSRLQTTSSCIGKEPFVVSVEEKAWQKTVSGEDQGDERKRITDEVSKYQRWRQNWGACRSPG